MSTASATDRRRRRRGKDGFTLIEVMVTSILVAIAVVGVFGGLSSLTSAQYHAQTADLLQRLAAQKMNDLRILSDPTQDGNSGDFTDRGYPNITWNADVQAAGVTNLDQVTVTVTQGKDSQTLSTMMYVPPATSTGTGTTGTGATGGTAP